ncbi:MAG: Crp/Fnr family transcriptional regulator [Lachnospiraceae bacterium]|nr:Crp/Fnr family transcriptional regulator [Lachnospiraceae bacterium]
MEGKNRLFEIECLKNVSHTTLDKIWRNGSIVEMPKQSVFIRAREPAGLVHFVLSGKVMVYNLTNHGKRKIIFIFGKGVLLNENVLNPRYCSNFYETMERSRIFVIGSGQFLKYMEEDFSLVRAVMEEQERKIWRLSHQLKNTMGSIYMERKLAAKLWKLARDFGKPTKDGIEIDFNMTVTFLADLMGAPRETVSRICKTLTEAGLMKMEKRRITLPDPDRMARFYKEGKL